MSGGPHTPPVTDAAIDAAAGAFTNPERVLASRAAIRRALEAAAPHMVPPPELPTEPGSVVLASRAGGREFDPPVVAVLSDDRDALPWWVPFGNHDQAPEEITEWIPARVVPDDEHGPVAVLRRTQAGLRRTAEQFAGTQTWADIEDLLIVIGVCLERVDGDL